MKVTAVETAKTYEITLNANGGDLTQTKITLTFGKAYELPTPTHNNDVFASWKYNGQKIELQGTWTIDIEEDSAIFIAEWLPS